MDFTKKIKKTWLSARKYWENRDFRAKILAEKRRLYLVDKKPKPRVAFFPLHLKKKRFYYFNTIISILEENRNRFRTSFVLIGAFLIFSSAYIFFFSPYFRISPSRVIIERIDTITDINIAYRSIESFYGESIFALSTDDVHDHIVSLQKNIKHAEISRLFPNGLKIVIESYRPQFSVHIVGIEKRYVITLNGVLVYQKEADAKLPLLDIVDPSLAEAGFLDYKEGARGDFMHDIVTANDVFRTTFPAVNIAKLSYLRGERELHISLESGTKILIRLGSDIEKQIALLKFYNDNNKDVINSGWIEYIDTRVIGKFFVCRDKTLCKKNLTRVYGNYYQ